MLTITEDPKALAGDMYKQCFSKNLRNYEKVITDQVNDATKKLRDGFSYAQPQSNPNQHPFITHR